MPKSPLLALALVSQWPACWFPIPWGSLDPKTQKNVTSTSPARRQVYKDANHKPEMAIALTNFEALCGFVGHEELVCALDATPELAACVGPDPVAALRAAGADGKARRAALRQAFTALMLCDAGKVSACCQVRPISCFGHTRFRELEGHLNALKEHRQGQAEEATGHLFLHLCSRFMYMQ